MNKQPILLIWLSCLFCAINLQAQKPSQSLQKNRQGDSMTFDDTECSVAFIEITKFQDALTGKPYQVVVGRDIDYEAKLESGTNWLWEFTSAWSSFKAKSPRYISNNTLVGTQKILADDLINNNGLLGDMDGEVRVSAESPNGTERSVVVSTSDPNGPWKAKVYFLRDERYFGHTNWFHYWEQELHPEPLNYLLFNEAEDNYESATIDVKVEFSFIRNDLYGETDKGLETTVTFRTGELEHVAIKFAPIITLTIRSGEKNNETESLGVACFHEVLEHEKKHIQIFRDFWTNGYSSLNDIDRDLYPDDWEMSQEGMALGFMVDPSMTQNDAYSNTSGAGYSYEESVCRSLERQISNDPSNMEIYKRIDWSFDPSGTYQGVNW